MDIAHFGWNTPFASGDTAFAAHPRAGEWLGAAAPNDVSPRTGAATRPASQARRFDQAIGLLESGEWQRAYATLGGLANEGHRPAARMALVLAQRGTVLFGGSFRASARELQRWQALGG